jgi:mono/diheme cytochrome c family protein
MMGACATAPDGSDSVPEPALAGFPGFFSDSQADRGRETFAFACSECHTTSDFRGDDFEWEWRRRTVWDLYRRLRETMPEDNPGSLSPGLYADVIAYILQINQYASGDAELIAEEESMDTIPLGPDANKTGRSASSGNDGR